MRCRKDGHWEAKSFKRENNTLTNGSFTNDNKPSSSSSSSSSSRKPVQNKNLNSRAEGQSQNPCSFCGGTNHPVEKCWKKKKEEKKKTEVNLIDFNLSNDEAEANEAITDYEFLAKCEVLIASDRLDCHKKAAIELNDVVKAWAIVDSGAEVSMMAKEIFEKIDLPEIEAPINVYAFEGLKVLLT